MSSKNIAIDRSTHVTSFFNESKTEDEKQKFSDIFYSRYALHPFQLKKKWTSTKQTWQRSSRLVFDQLHVSCILSEDVFNDGPHTSYFQGKEVSLYGIRYIECIIRYKG